VATKSATIKLDGNAAYKKMHIKEGDCLRDAEVDKKITIKVIFFCVLEAQRGCGNLIREASRSHTRTHPDSSG
jgi:hypothetical protein